MASLCSFNFQLFRSKKACYKNYKFKYTIFLQFTNTIKQRKRPFVEIPKNIWSAVIFLSTVARSQSFTKQWNFWRTLKIRLEKVIFSWKCLTKVRLVQEKWKYRKDEVAFSFIVKQTFAQPQFATALLPFAYNRNIDKKNQ